MFIRNKHAAAQMSAPLNMSPEPEFDGGIMPRMRGNDRREKMRKLKVASVVSFRVCFRRV